MAFIEREYGRRSQQHQNVAINLPK